MPKRPWMVGLPSLLAAACSSSPATQPPLPPCTATSGGAAGAVSQVYAGVTIIDPTQTSGCAVFQANASGAEIDYLLVPQAVNGVPDDSSRFLLGGAALPSAPAPAPAADFGSAPLGAQQRFDLTLRRAERELAAHLGPLVQPRAAPPIFAQPFAFGDRRPFKVCGTIECNTHPTVVGFVRKVGAHVVVFQDSVDEANGRILSSFDLDTLAAVFDTLLYPADTSAFGRESDIDGNGVVMVLMTGKVNALVASPCTGGSIAGYFYGGDLLVGFSGGNSAEVFYAAVPDPNGNLSCPHSANGVKRTVPGTFIHEFQHMISFNQHVLLRGSRTGEELWLNEGLSHYAEELGGRLFLPGDSTTFCYFIFGDLYNSAQFLASPESHLLVDTAGIGGLPNRGAWWLFVRFVVDQFSTDTTRAANNVVTRALDVTASTGASNVRTATGTPFATVVERWALANYVSDLAGFTTPPELQYKKWRFRADYVTIHDACVARIPSNPPPFPSSYPLIPGGGTGSALNISGTMRGGSGTYVIAQHPVAAGQFALRFSDPAGRALRSSLAPRLNVIRIQ